MSLGRIDGFNVKDAILIALIFVFVSSAVSIFNSFFYKSRFMEYKAQEIGLTFQADGDFSKNAKELLSSRGDIIYIKLLGSDGALKESFGNGDEAQTSEFTLSTQDGNRVLVGIRELENDGTTLAALIFSILIGGVSGVCLIMVLIMSCDQSASMEKLVAAMKRVSRGDTSAKLEAEDFMGGNSSMLKIFESFNAMMDQLRKRSGIQTIEPEQDAFSEPEPKAIFDEREIIEDKIAGFRAENFTPAPDDRNSRRTVALVAKIANFEELSAQIEPARLASFLTEYRKSASAIISDYGGFTETLLQDEIVALFNVPEKQDKPELRAICASVEVLQALSEISKKRGISPKHVLAAKVGIDAKPLAAQSESAIPSGVGRVIGAAKSISEGASNWGVVVSLDVYAAASAYVQAKQLERDGEALFAIVGVEEGVIEV
ncbi:MAG: adenylate/guanylate cyclase domain-containing protein [Deltaproteobacteria bacterium]